MLHVLQLLFYCFLCRVLALAFALEEVKGDSQLKRSTNRVATKVRTYFEMRTDGQRFFV